MIDLRSDTVTRPTPAMLDAMMRAPVGDDVFGEDPTVNALQEKAAAMFGMEAALFCPTGTMTNQIGIRVHVQPGDEVICHELSHVYLYEGGGIAATSGASVRLLKGNNGKFTAEQVAANVNVRADSHFPWTRLVTIENTMNKGGGACWDLAEIERIRKICLEQKLALHLDGARLFNAMVARKESAKRYGELFDTVSICLSKGLGAPAGSVLLGRKEHVARAHRYRKMMGGGMRQAGYIAAGGLYALDHHVERLQQDHNKAAVFGRALHSLSWVAEVLPVETNIVIFSLQSPVAAQGFTQYLKEKGIRLVNVGGASIRAVFHLDVSDAQLDAVVDATRKFSP